ncbi:uncharacterized protein LOC114523035 isoform X2 [Dendronephthya gigantea]|uniref:uncharacterized protein LOC114523035 isoform X2 n=1 Tax=Dendronephthya gigantea TaxID=151771 RepID=UPI00106CD4DF|nr:uncharacterized protein LOC114523035 isoform X2 [Dendronephthya gigantea]
MYVSAQLRWRLKSKSGGPSPRRDVAIGYDPENKQILIFGGRDESGPRADTWAFNLSSLAWKELKTKNDISGRFSVVSGVWNNGFYVSTGQAGASFFDDIWRLDLSTLVWKKLLSRNSPEERYGSAGGFFQHGNSSFFYLTHGFADMRYSNTFMYDVSKEKGWTEVFTGTSSYNPNYPHARCLHSATMLSAHKFIMYGGCLGGGGTGGPCPSDDAWMFDGEQDEWKRLPHCASPRKYSAMALLPIVKDANGNNIVRAVLYGGGETSSSVITVTKAPPNEIVIYNPEADKWTKKTINGTSPGKRDGHAMVTIDSGIIMFGGKTSNGLENDIWLLEGNVNDVKETADGEECNLLYFSYIQLHGIFMFIGWGLLLQLGMFFARYFRQRDPWWFKMHRALQVSGLIVSIFGFAFAVVSVPFSHFMFAHGGIGLLIMIIGLLQPLNAFFRPHKTDPKTLKRMIWEIYHINAGRVALILALINISLGVFLAVVPYTAWVVWFIMFAVWVAILIVMEVRLQYSRYSSGQGNMMEMTNQ